MAGVTGDFSRLSRLASGMKDLSQSKGVRTRIAQRMAASAMKLIADSFINERDPYGVPWKPLRDERYRDERARKKQERKWKKAKYTPTDDEVAKLRGKILNDTGRLRTTVDGKRSKANARAGAWGFRIAVPVKYAATHQYGATIVPKTARRLAWRRGRRWIFAKKVTIPARPFLPTKARGLPEKWNETFRKDAAAVIKDALSGSGREGSDE